MTGQHARGPLGLYIHVPFCPSVCPYCSFNVVKARAVDWEAFTDALLSELRARFAHETRKLTSLYFGGGTPSLLPPASLARLTREIERTIGFEPDAERTLEAEPETLTASVLATMRACGITRLSIGWQSTHDRLLKILGRRHTAEEGARAIKAARQAGFSQITADLIFAVPTQTLGDLAVDLSRLVDLGPDHISLYALTYEPKTPFFRWRKKGMLAPAPEDLECEMMDLIGSVLERANYEHYEVSNFGKPNMRGKHNTLYWQGGEYIGIGPGAHSFVYDEQRRGWRWQNNLSVKAYSAMGTHWSRGIPLKTGGGILDVDCLSAHELFVERMIGACRHVDGICLNDPALATFPEAFALGREKAQALGWAQELGTRFVPTKLGMRHADGLAALFV